MRSDGVTHALASVVLALTGVAGMEAVKDITVMDGRPAKRYLERAAAEPPLRLLMRWCVEHLSKSVRTRAVWDAARLPPYLVGLLAGADQAIREGRREISVMELGVASGRGLLTLQSYAAMVEDETGIRVHLYGFDSGLGLPSPAGFRDHADWWAPGDYPMNEQLLRSRLSESTALVLGDVAETVPRFVHEEQSAPIAFAAFDLDLYSSTRDALQLFSQPDRNMLRRVPVYFDDLHWEFSHHLAGEQLAIAEFNENAEDVSIDPWVSLRYNRPFPEAPWLDQMYQVHDLSIASPPRSGADRAPVHEFREPAGKGTHLDVREGWTRAR